MIRRLTGITTAVVSVLLASNVSSQNLTFSGKTKTETGIYVRGNDTAGHFSDIKETLTGTVDASADKCETYITGTVSFNGIKAAKTGSNSALDGLGADLKEAWINWTSDPTASGLTAGFKIGRQITAWGKADEVRIADVLCPQDLTVLDNSEYSESRIGIDACKFNVSGTSFSADAYWIPLFRPALLFLESWNPLRSSMIPDSVSLGTITRPEASIENSCYAARLSFWLPAADFSLYGYYGYDDSPITSYISDSSGITANGEYYKYGMAGFDAAIPVKQLVFRAESALFIQRALARTPEKAIADGISFLRGNQLLALAGVDWIHDVWVVTGQFYDDMVLDYDDSLDRKQHMPSCTLRISRTFFSETLTLAFSGSINLNDCDSYAGLSAEYAITDQVMLKLQGDGYFPGPKSDGTLGKYKDLSSVKFSGTYRF